MEPHRAGMASRGWVTEQPAAQQLVARGDWQRWPLGLTGQGLEDGRRRLAGIYALMLISGQHANEGAHGRAMADRPATAQQHMSRGCSRNFIGGPC